MGWWEDLQDLVGPENLPFDELAAGDWGGAATAPLTAAFNLMDAPLSAVKEGIGQAQNVAQGEGLGSWGTGRKQWEEDIYNLNEADLGAFGFAKTPIMIALELGLDPVNLLGVGAAKHVPSLLRTLAASPEVGKLASTGLKGIAGGIDVGNFAFNEAPGKLLSPVARAGGSLSAKAIKRVVPNALDLEPKSELRRYLADVRSARSAQLANRMQYLPGEHLPVPIRQPDARKSLAPLDEYNVPPFFDTQFDSGVSKLVKQRAYDAYARLAAKHQSFPDIPGINAPGVGRAAPGDALFAAQQRPGLAPRQVGASMSPSDPNASWAEGPGRDFGQPVPYGKPGSPSFLDRLRDKSLGIANLPARNTETMFHTPFDLGQLDEQDLRDMAAIGAAVMMDFDNDVSNKLFPSLRRSSEGFSRVRKELVRQFGAGVEPALPAMYQEFRQLLDAEGITVGEAGARFLTHWGFPEGSVSSEGLDRIQRQVDEGKIDRDQAFAKIAGKAFNKGKPGLVEQSAGMGAGFLATERNPELDSLISPFEGPYAPSAIDPATGRAMVAEEFSSQFNRNKESYDRYMAQLFGDMSPEELDTLRGMSVEALYDEMMNAASEFSGGEGGATTLLQKGRPVSQKTQVPVYQKDSAGNVLTDDGGNPIPKLKKDGTPLTRTVTATQYGTDEFSTKISMFPGDETSIAAQRETISEDMPGGKIGKPSLKSLNLRRLEEVQGQPVTSSQEKWTNKRIVEKIEQLGGRPYTDNPTGGPLMTTQKLIDHFQAGKDIPVGETVAKDWYGNAVDEVMRIVGPGNYEDAMMLIELMAVTSSGTGVADNAENALRAFAEWKLGSSHYIREKLNLTNEQVDAILNKGGRWTGIRGNLEEDKLFMGAMAESQKRAAGKVFQNYIERRMALDPEWSPSQAGPKTNNYAGSFLIKIWQDAIDHYMPSGELRDKVKSALDEAATIYTVDRHDARQDNLATAVTGMGAVVTRESRLIGTKKLPGVRPEDIQAATWYWAKDRQGFTRMNRTDDMAVALRDSWNRRVAPGLDTRVREDIRSQNPNLSEEEMMDVADDMMRQEVVYAFVNETLQKNKKHLGRILGEDHPLAALTDVGNNALGIVHRASRGVAPGVPLSRRIPDITTQAETMLRQVHEGSSQGGTFKFANGTLAPEDATSGFAVPLATLGNEVSPARRKTASKSIEKFLGRYSEIFDDPTVAENIRFGVSQTGKGATFDLSVVVPDEQTAIALGKKYGQESIRDLASGQSLFVGAAGSRTAPSASQLRKDMQGLFGRRNAAKPTIDEVRRRGITIDEMDSVNPLSIFHRKVVEPIMTRYRELSESGAAAQAASTAPGPKQGVLVGQPDPAEAFDFSSIYQDPLLSTQENMILSENVDGELMGSRLDRWHDEARKDIQALDDSGIGWDPNTSLKERMALLDSRPDLQKIVKKYHDMGLDIRYADPHSIEMRQLERAESKRRGIDMDRRSTWDLLRAAWGEQALFSPKYHTGNVQGSWIQNALAGHVNNQGPGQVLSAFKIVRGGLEGVDRKEALNSLHTGQIAQKWGYEELPSYIYRGGIRDMVSSSGAGTRSAMGELAGKITRSDAIGRKVGRPFEANADMAQAVDIVGRGAVWSDVLDREMTNAMLAIEDDINVMARRQGLEGFEFSMSEGINPVPGGASAKKLKSHLQRMGFAEGYAERAGRNFAEARNTAEKIAKKEMERVQFSYDRTNLDEFIGKVVPFHYWYSRALRYYGEETVRHPYLFLNYMRANDGIEDAQDDPGLSARQKGFLKLMSTPLGFSLLMNPDSLIGVIKITGIDSSVEPDGETSAGGIVRWLKERGLGLFPWIDGSLNIAGMYGDTFEPDLLGVRHKALIGATINYFRSQLGMEPAAAPYADAMGQARYGVSSFVSQFTPDWLTQPVLPKAGGSSQDATIDTVIESRIIANNPGMTNQELIDIMSDPDSPEFRQAYQQAASAGIIQQLMNFSLPQNYRMREESRDVRQAQVNTIFEAAEAQGVSPTEFRPSLGDTDFAARYEALTGRAWRPGDYQRAKTQQDIIRATPEAKPFVLQEGEYYSLGTDKQREIFQKYQDIMNGKNPRTAGLESDQRRMLAQSWADKLGYTGVIQDMYQLRGEYERTHVEFAGFTAWRDKMYDLQNHLGGDLGEYRRRASAENPNAAKYFGDMIEYVHREYPQRDWQEEIERRTVSADAYQSITGKKQARFDPAPAPGFPAIDPVLPQMSDATQQGPSNQDWQWMQVMNQLPGRLANF